MTAIELWERLLDDLVALLPRALRPRNARMGYWASRLDACVHASSVAAVDARLTERGAA